MGGARSASAIPLMWARAEVAERVRALARPTSRVPNDRAAAENAQLISEITNLGLTFGITTRYTGFVAVAERTTTPAAMEVAQLPKQASFAGSSAPEPAEWAALLVMLAMMGFAVRRSAAARAY